MKVSEAYSRMYLEGVIEKGDFERFIKGIRQYKFVPEFVSISSPGGDVETAMKFGRFFRRAATQVKIEKGAECNSSCFLMLVGATERVFRADVGIHRPYYDRDVFGKLSPTEASDYFREMNKTVRAYLIEMDVPTELIDRMMSIESSSLEYLTAREIELAIDTFAPSHEEWLLARCGISLSDELTTDTDASFTTDEEQQCWSDAISSHNKSVLQDILSQ